MQLKFRGFFTSVANEIKMCRICTSYVSYGSGEMVSGATGGECATATGIILVTSVKFEQLLNLNHFEISLDMALQMSL